MSVWDIVNQDPFNTSTLTLSMIKQQYVPSGLSAAGLFQEAGVIGIDALIEELQEIVSQIPVKPRGAPGDVVKSDKRKLRSILIPHLPQQGSITADEIRTLRQFGSEQLNETIQSRAGAQMLKMRKKIDYTIEAHRVVALKGGFIDRNGDNSSAFTFFGVDAPSAISLALSTSATALRKLCSDIITAVENALGGNTYAEINVQCDPTLWGLLIDHPAVKETYLGYAGATERAGQIVQSFVFGMIRWHRYRGDSSVGMGTKAAYAYPTGVDGMFITRFAPSTWLDSIGTDGLPYYVKSMETREGDAIQLLAQSNPLNICTRPNAVIPLTTP